MSDVERRMVWVSPSVERVLGYAEADFLGIRTFDLIHPDDLPEATRAAATLRGPERTFRCTLRLQHGDGRWVWCDIVGRNMLDTPFAGVVSTLRDVSERRALEEELLRQATHDELSALANRRGFLARLGEALAVDAAPHVGLLMIDLDHFKTTNDRHGHLIGDELLREFSARLAGALRPGDLAGRLGGDEFAVLCRRVDDPQVLQTIAERIRALAGGRYRFGEVDIAQGLSIGGATARPDEDPIRLMGRADSALYRAKALGRNRTSVAASTD